MKRHAARTERLRSVTRSGARWLPEPDAAPAADEPRTGPRVTTSRLVAAPQQRAQRHAEDDPLEPAPYVDDPFEPERDVSTGPIDGLPVELARPGSRLRHYLADRYPLLFRGSFVRLGAVIGLVISLALILAVTLALTVLKKPDPASGVPRAAAPTPIPWSEGAEPSVGSFAASVGGSAGTGPSPTTVPTTVPSDLVVDVQGVVKRPGVVRVPAGSRVVDAVRAAGGIVPGKDGSGINLAAPIVDGMQIVVGPPGRAVNPAPANPTGPAGGAGGTGAAGANSSAAAGAGGAAGAGSSGAGQGAAVNLNQAGVSEFDALPGIGPVLAQRIVDFREANGPFTTIDELRAVSGIGEKTFADLRDRITV